MLSPALPPDPAAPSGLPVLIVDDEDAIRLALRRALARDGWTVEEAATGPAALALLRDANRDYAAIILDLTLPGLSGHDIYEWLKAERPALLQRLIFSSGAPSPFLDATACPVLRKPFELAALRALVRQLAGG